MRLFTALVLVPFAFFLALIVGSPSIEAPEVGLLDVIERPAEQALMLGIRAYEDGQYAEADKQLNLALSTGLKSGRDRAAADKHLAFIHCSSNRIFECEAAFQAARRAYPLFTLTRSELGHPLWGPIYQRLQQP